MGGGELETGPASIAAIVRHLGVCRFRIGSGSARLVGSSRVRACSSDARQSVSTVDLPIPSCVSAKADSGRCTRHRWIGNSATTRALQGRRMARFSSGSRLGKARTLSTYLDSLRETAASQGIERVVNGSLDTRAIGVVSHERHCGPPTMFDSSFSNVLIFSHPIRWTMVPASLSTSTSVETNICHHWSDRANDALAIFRSTVYLP